MSAQLTLLGIDYSKIKQNTDYLERYFPTYINHNLLDFSVEKGPEIIDSDNLSGRPEKLSARDWWRIWHCMVNDLLEKQPEFSYETSSPLTEPFGFRLIEIMYGRGNCGRETQWLEEVYPITDLENGWVLTLEEANWIYEIRYLFYYTLLIYTGRFPESGLRAPSPEVVEAWGQKAEEEAQNQAKIYFKSESYLKYGEAYADESRSNFFGTLGELWMLDRQKELKETGDDLFVYDYGF